MASIYVFELGENVYEVFEEVINVRVAVVAELVFRVYPFKSIISFVYV